MSTKTSRVRCVMAHRDGTFVERHVSYDTAQQRFVDESARLLHEHHRVDGVLVLSHVTVDDMENKEFPLCVHPLPSRLNMYVYPEEVLFVSFNDCSPSDLTLDNFERLVSVLDSSDEMCMSVEAVYDVSWTAQNEVECNGIVSDEEEVEEDDETDYASENDEEEWQPENDDDIVPAVDEELPA